MATVSRLPLILLAITYWLYFGQLGVLVPYLGIFLDGRGFTSADIGELFAVITLARIIGPSLWANIADKTGKSVTVLRLGCMLTVACFSSVLFMDSFWGLTLSFGLMMMFWTAVLPQLEVITMQTVAKTGTGYGQIRLWGSIGFIVLTVAVGKALDFFSSETPVYVSLGTLTALFVSTLFIRHDAPVATATSSSGHFWQAVLQRPFVFFILASSLLQMSFGAYYGFFALYMRDLNYSGQQTGLLIALGVLAEIGIFLIARRLIGKWGVWMLLLVCQLATAARWYGLAAFADNPWVVVLSQVIHALSFGLTHAVSVHFIHHYFAPQFQSRGQAIYISLAFGLGGALGNFMSGQLWEQGTQAYLTFTLSAVMAFIGGLLLFLCPRDAMDKPQQTA